MTLGGIIVIIIIVIVLGGITGGVWPATGSNGGTPTGQGCEACKGLDHWWSGLRGFQKLRMIVWYQWKKADCWMRGCPTG